MILNIVALFIFIFGAYAYGYLALLWRRERSAVWAPEGAPSAVRVHGSRVTITMFVTCTLWFVLHAIIVFRMLLGDPPEDDLIDLATLELVLMFPGLIFHAYLLESRSVEQPFDQAGKWYWLLWALYASGVAAAVYFPAAIFRVLPGPARIGPFIGLTVGALFVVMSVASIIVASPKSGEGGPVDERRLRLATRLLFVFMIGAFLFGNTLQSRLVLDALGVAVRTTPLFFLLVSVYFENRIEFYDLVVKRGVLLLLSLLLIGTALAWSFAFVEQLPPGAARPWVLAVLLLPVAMIVPWMHDRVGRLLDRMWFGRLFEPAEAVRHVLGAMHAATDEPSLIDAAERALRDIFRRPVTVIREGDAAPSEATDVLDLRTPSNHTLRLAVLRQPGMRAILSEDLALLRSLGSVLGFLLDNVRLQRRRQEQEQLATDLRLQSSRSELKALRAQINPHFLFNALNAIASLIHTDPARADAVVEQLAEVFRYTLRRSEQEWAPLDQELQFARAYLDVEQARFGKRLEYSVHADGAATRAHVPSMLLQTLVENAVKHGISPSRGPGRIEIVAARRGGMLLLEVRDSGPGFDAPRGGASRSENFGLRNVRDRLRGHFGDNASLELVREDQVTVARIQLPVVEDLAAAAGAAR